MTGDETNIEAFQRKARELLEEPEIDVMYPSEASGVESKFGSWKRSKPEGYGAEISVTHYGEPDALNDLADAHPAVEMWSYDADVMEISAGDHPIRVVSADFVMTEDPHEELDWSGGGSGGGSASSPPSHPASRSTAVSGSSTGSGSSAGVAPSSTEDDDSEAQGDDESVRKPEPMMQYVLVGSDGDKAEPHLATESEGVCACRTKYVGKTPIDLGEKYESVDEFLKSADACLECRAILADHLRLPEERVPREVQEERRG